MTIATWPNECKLGAVALKASGNTTGSTKTVGTAIEVGNGRFLCETKITVLDVASNDERYTIDIEANSRDATTTWRRVATVFAGGAKEVTGRDDDDAASEHQVIVDNPYDYQVRYVIYLVGSTATGITSAINLYPVPRKE